MRSGDCKREARARRRLHERLFLNKSVTAPEAPFGIYPTYVANGKPLLHYAWASPELDNATPGLNPSFDCTGYYR